MLIFGLGLSCFIGGAGVSCGSDIATSALSVSSVCGCEAFAAVLSCAPASWTACDAAGPSLLPSAVGFGRGAACPPSFAKRLFRI